MYLANLDYCLDTVSYTHLDVYKRQLHATIHMDSNFQSVSDLVLCNLPKSQVLNPNKHKEPSACEFVTLLIGNNTVGHIWRSVIGHDCLQVDLGRRELTSSNRDEMLNNVQCHTN